LRELAREAEALGLVLLPGVKSYATDPDYLDALEDRIRQSLSNSPDAALVFSAHGLPLRQIRAGDPYERELHATIDALKTRLGPIPGGCHLAYQSKVGPMAWLGPSLETVLKNLAGRDVVVCPISFTGEHIETLHELDIHYRALAQRFGIQGYARVPAPGLHPAFIRCLAKQTLGALEHAGC
ncbi:MAG TPA: ferrochelatase, partial [Holophaga sp.]|nr:ferrochelatase [Holophaga sp.]